MVDGLNGVEGSVSFLSVGYLGAKASGHESTPGYLGVGENNKFVLMDAATAKADAPGCSFKINVCPVATVCEPEVVFDPSEYLNDHVRIIPAKSPEKRVRHRNSNTHCDDLKENDELFDKDSHWIIRAGLTGEGVSIESFNFPNMYIRHRNHLGRIDNCSHISRPNDSLLAKDATFFMVKGFSGPNTVSFRSVNYPKLFLVLLDDRFQLCKSKNMPKFKFLASFKLENIDYEEPVDSNDQEDEAKWIGKHVRLEASNFPDNFIRHEGGNCILNKFEENKLFKADSHWIVRPGFTGSGVSLESSNYPGSFIRHQNSNCKISKIPKTVKPDSLLAKDATFDLEPALNGKNDEYSFECSNFPQCYLRHQNNQFKIGKDEHTPLFDADGSWKLKEIEAPAEKEAFVEPELVGQHIRLESLNFPNHFVRHRNSQCWKDANSEGKLYDDDSHWVVRAGLAGEGISFESSNYSAFMNRKIACETGFNSPVNHCV